MQLQQQVAAVVHDIQKFQWYKKHVDESNRQPAADEIEMDKEDFEEFDGTISQRVLQWSGALQGRAVTTTCAVLSSSFPQLPRPSSGTLGTPLKWPQGDGSQAGM
jgi:hypothetical protein